MFWLPIPHAPSTTSPFLLLLAQPAILPPYNLLLSFYQLCRFVLSSRLLDHLSYAPFINTCLHCLQFWWLVRPIVPISHQTCPLSVCHLSRFPPNCWSSISTCSTGAFLTDHRVSDKMLLFLHNNHPNGSIIAVAKLTWCDVLLFFSEKCSKFVRQIATCGNLFSENSFFMRLPHPHNCTPVTPDFVGLCSDKKINYSPCLYSISKCCLILQNSSALIL